MFWDATGVFVRSIFLRVRMCYPRCWIVKHYGPSRRPDRKVNFLFSVLTGPKYDHVKMLRHAFVRFSGSVLPTNPSTMVDPAISVAVCRKLVAPNLPQRF